MSLKVHVCGARGSFPTYGKEYDIYGQDTSCYVIRDGSYAIILDCGSGLAGAAGLLAGCKKIDVLLSHIHYDHILGLFELPPVFGEAEVGFYGAFDAWISTEKGWHGQESLFRIEDLTGGRIHPVNMNTTYEMTNGFRVGFTPSSHGDDTAMIDIRKDGKRICFTGDYEHCDTSDIGLWARGCDLLMFDGSYTQDNYQLFQGWGHSRWEDGCRIAKENGIRQLLIVHHAPQSDDRMLAAYERKSWEIFERTIFAKQGREYRVE